MVSLVKAYVSKGEGVVNPPYSSKVLDFFLALTASGYDKAFEFVSGNLHEVLLHHMQQLNHKQLTKPLINIYQHEIVTLLGKQMARIRCISNDEVSRVVSTASIDGIVIVKSYQMSFSHGVLVGGAYHNQYLSIDKVKGEGIKLFSGMPGWTTWATCVRD